MAPPASKKRKIRVTAPAEITFDFSAREEYLTGFHKRKVARAKHAQEEAAKKEREERIRLRREARQERKEELERHVSEVNALLKQAHADFGVGPANPSGSEASDSGDEGEEEAWEGFGEPAVEPVDREDEYVDEDKYTTVTIESVGISKDGFERAGDQEGGEGEGTGEGDGGEEKKKVWSKERPKVERPKKKKKKFRYESKAERKVTNAKQRMKNKAAAAARKGK